MDIGNNTGKFVFFGPNECTDFDRFVAKKCVDMDLRKGLPKPLEFVYDRWNSIQIMDY
jgi:hypothetical protein